MICRTCGAEIHEGKRYCTRCGIPLRREGRSAICPVCGEEVQPHEAFCSRCGTLASAFRKRPASRPAPVSSAGKGLGDPQCPGCGGSARTHRRFCTACGKRLAE